MASSGQPVLSPLKKRPLEGLDVHEELEQCKKELLILREDYRKLDADFIEVRRLQVDHLATEITEYLNECNSLTETAEKFESSPEDIYRFIPEWDDCNDRLYGLDDYKMYSLRFEGRCGDLDE